MSFIRIRPRVIYWVGQWSAPDIYLTSGKTITGETTELSSIRFNKQKTYKGN